VTEFIRDKAGADEASQKKALAYLFAQDSTGLATDGVLTGLAVSQQTTASASVNVAAGAGVVQDSAGSGASMVVNDTQLALDVLTANPMGGTPRNDLIVFDSATVSAGTGGLRVIVGTPNAVPTDPTVPATALKLARIRNLASATTVPAAQIDDLRTFTSLFGVLSQATIDNDSGWQTATLNTGWTNASGYTTQYRRKNGRVEVRGMVVRGSGASTAFFTLPVGYRPSSTVILGSFLTSPVGGASYDLFCDTTGAVGFASSGYVSGTTATGSAHPVGGSFLLG
jgi:hypothetical protein